MPESRHNFVVFSDDWGRHPSSCQHLFAQLGRRHRVLWVNTIGLRAAKADGFTARRAMEKFAQWSRPLRQVGDDFFVYDPVMLPAAGGLTGQINRRWVARRLRRVLWRCGMARCVLFASAPTAAEYVGLLDERAVVYYVTDDYRFWPGGNSDAIAAQDALLTQRADLLLPVSEALAAGRNGRGRLELLPHGVDLEHFAQADDALPVPPDLADIPRPRLCFFGLIYEKTDLDLLAALARREPQKHVVLIGPVKTDVSPLAALPNVHVLGPKHYAELPAYLRQMDVLLLAYRADEQIARSAPLKIRECLAAGKPVVARSVPDLRRFADLIHLADDDESFIRACRVACEQTPIDPARLRAAVAADTWSARAEQVERALAKVLAAKARPVDGLTRIERDTDPAEWDSYVAAHAAGAVWHRHGWPEAMRRAYGLRCDCLAARRDGRLVGVLPLALQASRTFGRHLVSLPWLDHAGILADDAPARAALLAAATDLARQCGADLVLRELSPAAAPDVRTEKVALTLDLPATADELWASLKAKVRNQVRKADKSDLTTAWAAPEALKTFHQIYATNMRDLASPPHSLAYFREVAAALGELFRVALVHKDGQPLAAAIVLTDLRGWQVPWASSRREHNGLCPNHALYWFILAEACGRTPRFCFGRSTVDSGTYNFKAQWGAQPTQLYWQHYLGAAPPAAAADDGAGVVGLVQRAWKRMPASLTTALGPHIIKHVG